MARYIDADKFIKQFERALEHQQKYGLYNHAKLTEYVIKAIENEPTADVVPKSEVEFLRKTIAENAQRSLEVTLEEIEKAKAEVAREIFEEIEKVRMISRACEKRGITYDFSEFYAELKKKYTEGNDEISK